MSSSSLDPTRAIIGAATTPGGCSNSGGGAVTEVLDPATFSSPAAVPPSPGGTVRPRRRQGLARRRGGQAGECCTRVRSLSPTKVPCPQGTDWRQTAADATGVRQKRARGKTQDDQHLLALLVPLKAYQRLGYFPKLADVPAVVAEQIRSVVGLPEGVMLAEAAERSAKRHRSFVRTRMGVIYDAVGPQLRWTSGAGPRSCSRRPGPA